MKILRLKKLPSVLLAITILTSISPGAFGTNHKPTLAQIKTAKQLELHKKQNVANEGKKLVAAQGNLRKIAAIDAEVNRRHLSARKDLVVAEKK